MKRGVRITPAMAAKRALVVAVLTHEAAIVTVRHTSRPAPESARAVKGTVVS